MSAITVSSEPDPRRRVRVWKEIEGEEPWYSFTVDTPEGERVREGGSATLAGVAASLRHVVMLDNLFAPMLALAEMKGAGEFVELAFPPLLIAEPWPLALMGQPRPRTGPEASPFAGLLTRAEAERLVIRWGLRDDPKLCNAKPENRALGKCQRPKGHTGAHESVHAGGGADAWGDGARSVVCKERNHDGSAMCDRPMFHDGMHAQGPGPSGEPLREWPNYPRNMDCCTASQPGTGIGCTQDAGHTGPHRCIDWPDDKAEPPRVVAEWDNAPDPATGAEPA